MVTCLTHGEGFKGGESEELDAGGGGELDAGGGKVGR